MVDYDIITTNPNPNAIYWNIFGMITMFIYVVSTISICEYAFKHKLVSSLVSRKMVHIAASNACLWLPLFDQTHYTWVLCVAVSCIYTIKLLVKGFIYPNPNDYDVKTMSRTGNPIELCQGPLMFVLVFIYECLYQFRTKHATYVMAALGYGDGIAPILGIYYPYLPYTYNNNSKTLSGSIGMFLGTIIGILVLRLILGEPNIIYINEIIGVAITATIAEAISGKWDNGFIAVSIWVYLFITSSSTN